MIEPFGDPMYLTVSKQEVDTLDIHPAMSILSRLVSSPEVAQANMEMVDVAFHGYDGIRDELFEIPPVRDYVHRLDAEFPFWLFFLDKRRLGLQCLSYCFLVPFLTDEAKAKRHPEQLQDLLNRRWFPATNEISVFAGFGEKEVYTLTDRAIAYFTTGRLADTFRVQGDNQGQKPDYGLRQINDGVSRDLDQFFYDFRLYSLSVIGPSQYSTMVDVPIGGEVHALSLDFDQEQLDQILSTAPATIAALVYKELLRDPSTARTIELEGEVNFGVRARLGELQEVQRESFVPLVAQEIL